jgi:hypothetical protein
MPRRSILALFCPPVPIKRRHRHQHRDHEQQPRERLISGQSDTSTISEESTEIKTSKNETSSSQVPDGPIQFRSVGNCDAFIHKLEENHVDTKEQLFNLSRRPFGFDSRYEFKANSVENNQDIENHRDDQQCLTIKKCHRMHFIGSYKFLNINNFEKDPSGGQPENIDNDDGCM